MANVVARIRRFNAGREPERLQMKYARMAGDAFTFFRGSCHLFYEDWPRRSRLNDAPLAWLCGDLHFENFGTYLGDNRLVYFDLNDFDESVLAPCTWDVTRFLTSLIVGAREYQLPRPKVRRLCLTFLTAYRTALGSGKPRWVERQSADGMIGQLLENLIQRTQGDLMSKWTKRTNSGLRLGRKRALPCTAQQHAKVRRLIGRLVREDGLGPLAVLDAGRRVAGTGSLGLERYAVLVQGPRMPGAGIGLLDIKIACPSSLEPYVSVPQPGWPSAAVRITTVQRRLQAIAPAFLTPVSFDGASYVVRELQPAEDRLDLVQSKGKLGRLETIASTMGYTVAWGHLRGSAHQGAAGPEDLMRFAGSDRWPQLVLEYADSYAGRAQQDWAAFAASIDQH